MKRRWLPFLLVALLGTLLPLAYASPPDPSWVAGLWDNGDHDDAVIAVVDTAESIAIATPVAIVLVAAVVALALAPEPAAPPTALAPTYRGRAPPRSS